MSESSQEDKPQLPNKKSDELQAKKDRSLAEFLLMLDDFKPLVETIFAFSRNKVLILSVYAPDSQRSDGLLSSTSWV